MALIEYFGGILAATAFFTIVDIAFTFPYRSNDVSPLRIFAALLIPLMICRRAKENGSLTTGGSFTAFFMGVTFILCSYTYTTMMLTFFFTSSRLTKYKANKKFQSEHMKMDVSDKMSLKGRDWLQVVSNGGIPNLLALVSLIDYGFGVERPVNFSRDYSRSWYDLAILGSLSCATGDTWASELGSVLASTDPVLVTSFRSVPRGTNGGISFEGTLASIFGGFCIGLTHWICIHLWSSEYLLSKSSHQYFVIFLGAIFGFIGSLVDSLLGATLQYSGMDKKQGIVVDKESDSVEYVCGCDYLSNNSVNFLSCFICSLLAPMLGFKLWA